MSRAVPGVSREAYGPPAMLLQLSAASPSVEIWFGDEDAGDASWVGEPATFLPRDIHGCGGREAFRCRGNGGGI